jgi:sortase A
MSKTRSSRIKAPKTPFSFSKHIVPPLAGLFVMTALVLALNGELILAQYRYRFTPRAAAAAIVTPSNPAKQVAELPKPDPSQPTTIGIPAININAPVVTDVTDTTEWKVQLGLRRGVVHYGQTALPGQVGNMVILGHSSGQAWAPGEYKWIFTLLDKLQPGDQIQISYQGLPYVYEVTDSVVVDPDNLDVLQPTDTPTLSLITCTPVGTSKNRLVVHAKQISPVYAPAKTATTASVEEDGSTPVATKKTIETKAKALPGSDHGTSLWQTVRSWF